MKAPFTYYCKFSVLAGFFSLKKGSSHCDLEDAELCCTKQQYTASLSDFAWVYWQTGHQSFQCTFKNQYFFQHSFKIVFWSIPLSPKELFVSVRKSLTEISVLIVLNVEAQSHHHREGPWHCFFRRNYNENIFCNVSELF